MTIDTKAPSKPRARKKTAPAVSPAVAEAASEETVVSVKGFDRDLRCRDFQFAIGQTYTHDGPVEACVSGFHACENPLDVFGYYQPGESRYALVTQGGTLARHGGDSKIASASITIGVELHLHELIQRGFDWLCATIGPAKTEHATGDRSASSATGDQSASSATGDQSASSATGYQSASSATGYRSASSATGDQSASSATGYRSASSATGKHSAAMSIGHEGRAMGANGCALFLVYRDPNTAAIKHAWAGIVGKDGIKPMVFYTLNADGKPVEV